MVGAAVINEAMRRDMLSQGAALDDGSVVTALGGNSAENTLVQPRRHHRQRRLVYRSYRGRGACFSATSTFPCSRCLRSTHSRYRRPQPMDLTVVVSVSGEVSRGIEVAEAARAEGATVVAVTASAQSSLARSSDVVIATPAPIDRSIPHCRDYSATLVALACVLEALCGRRFGELDAYPSVVAELVQSALRDAASLVTTSGRTWFLGAGPDRATAMYGSMKYWEAAGPRVVVGRPGGVRPRLEADGEAGGPSGRHRGWLWLPARHRNGARPRENGLRRRHSSAGPRSPDRPHAPCHVGPAGPALASVHRSDPAAGTCLRRGQQSGTGRRDCSRRAAARAGVRRGSHRLDEAEPHRCRRRIFRDGRC